MTEYSGIFEDQKIYKNNKGSILRTIVYTIQFCDSKYVLMLILATFIMIALTDAIVEPISKRCLVFYMDKFGLQKIQKK